jgi:hypothetical protein
VAFFCVASEARNITKQNSRINLQLHFYSNGSVQALISQLAELPCVNVLASVNHVLAPLLWDFRLLERFSFYMVNATSFDGMWRCSVDVQSVVLSAITLRTYISRPIRNSVSTAYTRDIIGYQTPLTGGDSESRARGIRYVLQSLTPNHRDCLVVLARKQVHEGMSGGVDFDDFLTTCRYGMLVVRSATSRDAISFCA